MSQSPQPTFTAPDDGKEKPSATAFRRIADEQVRMRIGQVVTVSGSRVLMMIDLPKDHSWEHMPRIGDAVCIETGQGDIVASVFGLSAPEAGIGSDESPVLIAELGIIGEFYAGQENRRQFRRSITAYPALQDIAASLTLEDRSILHGTQNPALYRLGEMSDASGLPAMIDGKALLSSNFSIIGMSGTGKSSAAACLVRTLIQNKHACRTVIIDVNSEYTDCFGKVGNVIRPASGMLSHWMLSFRELLHLLTTATGRLSDDETDLLAETVRAARRRYLQMNPNDWVREGAELSKVNVDMPVPYRLSDAIAYLDRSAHTDQRYGADIFRRLRVRLTSVPKDPKYSTFFSASGAHDTLAAFISRLFRIPFDGKPVTVLQLGEFSQEVVEIIVSAVARYMRLVAGAADSSIPFLFLIEDAHRFMPVDAEDAPLATRSLSKIIEKTGKNNISIGTITSQPRSLSAKAWEYCNTVFAMRLASMSDQERLGEVSPETASDTLASVGVLGNGEAIAVGQGVPLPMRFRFRRLPQASLPAEHRQHTRSDGLATLHRGADQSALEEVLDRWRYGVDSRSED